MGTCNISSGEHTDLPRKQKLQKKVKWSQMLSSKQYEGPSTPPDPRPGRSVPSLTSPGAPPALRSSPRAGTQASCPLTQASARALAPLSLRRHRSRVPAPSAERGGTRPEGQAHGLAREIGAGSRFHTAGNKFCTTWSFPYGSSQPEEECQSRKTVGDG